MSDENEKPEGFCPIFSSGIGGLVYCKTSCQWWDREKGDCKITCALEGIWLKLMDIEYLLEHWRESNG